MWGESLFSDFSGEAKVRVYVKSISRIEQALGV